MYRKKNIIMIVMCVAILFMIVGYAAFATKLSIKAKSNIASVWGIEITNITSTATGDAYNIKTPSYSGVNATFDAGFNKPGDKMVYIITVKNTGTVSAIISEIKAEAEGSEVISYSIDGLESNTRLASKAETTFTITVEFLRDATYIPTNAVKTLIIDMICIQDDGQTLTPSTPEIEGEYGKFTKAILLNNPSQSDSAIDFSKSSTEDGTKGLYYTNTNTENNKTTYYFRGAVENNYVQLGTYDKTIIYGSSSGMFFNSVEECHSMSLDFSCDTPLTVAGEPILWRIVRINEDGSVRLITQNLISVNAFNQKGYNETGYDNAQVGYMWGQTDATGDNAYELTHANINDSDIKETLDEWYTSNLSNYSNYLADAGFCNDRSVAPTANTWRSEDTALGYGTNDTYYGAYNRIKNLKQPQFGCTNPDNDLFTLKGSNKGNKALNNPIGLITADEVVYSGNGGSYLIRDDLNRWTMSPYAYIGGVTFSYEVSAIIGIGITNPISSAGVSPVINLKSNVEFTLEGTGEPGTSTNPYVIVTN